MFNLSGGLLSPPDTNTGLTFVTKDNVGPYLNTTSQVRRVEHAAEVSSRAPARSLNQGHI